MSIRTLTTALTLPILMVLAAPVRPAQACSADPCSGGHFLPAGGTVPSNLPAILWIPRSDGSATPDASGVALFQVTMDNEMAVQVSVEPLGQTGFLVRPASPLAPGGEYIVRGQDYCMPLGGMSPVVTEATLTVWDPIPFPTSLNTLLPDAVRVGPLTVSTVAGSCSSSITAAQAKIGLFVVAGIPYVPWWDSLFFETLVDGVLWHPTRSLIELPPPGSSWQGRGEDLLFASCASDDPFADKGLTKGPHTVLMRATLPGLGTYFETQTETIDLQCIPGSGDTHMPHPDDTAGCSAATGRFSAPDWGVSAAAVLGWVMLKRRRRTWRSN
jgi:hypothetical protein